ncbi:hypothetical protein AAFG13_08635 [Bradyrhizobium sp. B124]|uniref:hypothetical protein n=1 Tax=Bradyrhizobium sp. B124 TaxID=3140245 RepID=UPI003183B4D5
MSFVVHDPQRTLGTASRYRFVRLAMATAREYHRNIMRQHLLFYLLITLAMVQPADACSSAVEYPHTLLDRLPSTALKQSVVAVVEPIDLLPPRWAEGDAWGTTPLVKVRVLEAVQGVSEGQTFVVNLGGWMCGGLVSRNSLLVAGKRHFYIAGQFASTDKGDVEFVGKWVGNKRVRIFERE